MGNKQTKIRRAELKKLHDQTVSDIIIVIPHFLL